MELGLFWSGFIYATVIIISLLLLYPCLKMMLNPPIIGVHK